MKKFLTLVAVASCASCAFAQEQVTFGIARPIVNGVYDDFSVLTSTDEFVKDTVVNKTMSVKFYESDSIHATLRMPDAGVSQESPYYYATNIREDGSSVSVDYVWGIQCKNPNTTTHLHGVSPDTIPNEGYSFGFDFTVPAGKQLTLDSLYFKLLVEQNASTNIKIVKGDAEVWNSGWNYAANGYNSHKTTAGQWVYGWCFSFNKTGWNAFYGEDHSTLFATETVKSYMVSKGCNFIGLGDLVLSAGDYRVEVSVDWNNENMKSLSFKEVNATGVLADAVETGVKNVEADAVSGNAYNLEGKRVNANTKGIVVVNGKKRYNK